MAEQGYECSAFDSSEGKCSAGQRKSMNYSLPPRAPVRALAAPAQSLPPELSCHGLSRRNGLRAPSAVHEKEQRVPPPHMQG